MDKRIKRAHRAMNEIATTLSNVLGAMDAVQIELRSALADHPDKREEILPMIEETEQNRVIFLEAARQIAARDMPEQAAILEAMKHTPLSER